MIVKSVMIVVDTKLELICWHRVKVWYISKKFLGKRGFHHQCIEKKILRNEIMFKKKDNNDGLVDHHSK